MHRVSVIVPTYNNEATIERALESASRGLELLLRMHPGVPCDIVVVNDASTDGTRARAAAYAQTHPWVSVLSLATNCGAGAARNAGVRSARGDLLFFLDADDAFLDRHIGICFEAMQQHPEAQVIRTRIRLDVEIQPEWKRSIENSVVFNICVRRWCHDFIGGFLEDEAFKTYSCEDVIYRSFLDTFFNVGAIDEETVHHFHYPGNALDRQLKKFQAAGGGDSLRPEEKAARPRIEYLVKERQDIIVRQHRSLLKKAPP